MTQGRHLQIDHLVTAALVGDSGVGKTSLLLRETQNTFSSNFIENVGVDCRAKTYNILGKKIKVKMWDAPGTGKFKTALTDEAIKAQQNAQLIFIVYDVTDEQSFQNSRYYYRNIQRDYRADNSPIIILIGNKNDNVSEKLVESQRAQALANELDIPFCEVSAKYNQNVSETFQRAILEIYNRLYPAPVIPPSQQPVAKLSFKSKLLAGIERVFSSSSVATPPQSSQVATLEASLINAQRDAQSLRAQLEIKNRELAKQKKLLERALNVDAPPPAYNTP